VLGDLAKALPFAPESLKANREGRLADEQFSRGIARCSRPAIMAFVCFVAPILFWNAMTASREHISFFAAFPVLIGEFVHLGAFMEAQGKISAVLMVATTVGMLCLAAYLATTISTTLYQDLLGRRVVSKEGRVEAREEQIMRENGRDPIERYYFTLKTHTFPVSFAAYRALESGSVYTLYLLPRSNELVALEPKMG
jgi:hypothetical protein